jgi:hypothetical protein
MVKQERNSPMITTPDSATAYKVAILTRKFIQHHPLLETVLERYGDFPFYVAVISGGERLVPRSFTDANFSEIVCGFDDEESARNGVTLFKMGWEAHRRYTPDFLREQAVILGE